MIIKSVSICSRHFGEEWWLRSAKQGTPEKPQNKTLIIFINFPNLKRVTNQTCVKKPAVDKVSDSNYARIKKFGMNFFFFIVNVYWCKVQSSRSYSVRRLIYQLWLENSRAEIIRFSIQGRKEHETSPLLSEIKWIFLKPKYNQSRAIYLFTAFLHVNSSSTFPPLFIMCIRGSCSIHCRRL